MEPPKVPASEPGAAGTAWVERMEAFGPAYDVQRLPPGMRSASSLLALARRRRRCSGAWA